MVQIGLPSSDHEKISKEVAEHVMGIQTVLEERGFLPVRQTPPSAAVCLYLTKEHFNYLGRPTVGDYIELTARTDRSAYNEPDGIADRRR